MSKKLYIKTYGCQMNVYDSVKIQDVLRPHGFSITDEIGEADLVVLNTCHIREKAAEKVYSDLGRIRKIKEKRLAQGKMMVIAVAGCVAQAEGAVIKTRAPYVDIVVGPQAYQRLPQMIANADNDNVELDFAVHEKFDQLPEESAQKGPAGFLTIQEGCDKFCHFCVVPYTRGAEYSRDAAAVYREVLQQVSAGAKEMTLLGQNVNAYHGAGIDEAGAWNLATLMRHLAKIDGLERIRYTTSHPRDVDDELIEIHATEPKVMPFVHLPVQSGSDKILAAMNRKHTAEEYIKTTERMRLAQPEIEFSSDFIVGYPGETDADFEETLSLVREIGYGQIYSFTYSARSGTPAANMADLVAHEVKSERLQRLQALAREQQLTFNLRSVGQVVSVLFDRKGKTDGRIVGKTRYMQSVLMTAPDELIGDIIDVKIISAHANGLESELNQ